MDFGEVIRTFSESGSEPPNFFSASHQLADDIDMMQMYQLYSAGIMGLRTKLEILDSEFMLNYDHKPIHHIEHRLKTPASIKEKLLKRKLPLQVATIRSEIKDVAGIRVICSFLEDLYHVSGFLLSQKDVRLVEKKNYILSPKPSGYRSLHLVVSIPIYLSDRTEQVLVELQFRTIAMDFWASLEHQLKYKSPFPVPKHLHSELHDCADAIASLDLRMERIHQKILENRLAQKQEPFL